MKLGISRTTGEQRGVRQTLLHTQAAPYIHGRKSYLVVVRGLGDATTTATSSQRPGQTVNYRPPDEAAAADAAWVACQGDVMQRSIETSRVEDGFNMRSDRRRFLSVAEYVMERRCLRLIFRNFWLFH